MNTEQLKEEVAQPKGTAIKLSFPISWEGTDYTELNLNFEKLSGDDIIAIEEDFLTLNQGRNFHPFLKKEHPAYLAALAARALGVHPNFTKKLAVRDFNKVIGAANLFLTVTG